MKIKVLSINIHKGFSLFNRRFVLPQLRDAIHEVDADVVLLQEVVGENRRLEKKIDGWPAGTQLDFLAQGRWDHICYGKNAIYSHRHHGNAILSKFPIVEHENISLTNYRLEQRGLLHVQIKVPGYSWIFHVFNVHLDLTGISRRKQIQKIIARAKKHVLPTEPFVLGGDFNDWTGETTPALFEFLEVHECFHRQRGSHARSFPSFKPMLQLDRLYFRSLNLHSAKTLENRPWSRLSDHLPIVVEFDLL